MTNKKAPSLRFKGFTDDWEQRKVGELLTERNEQAPMCDEYPLMAFIANEGVAPKGERYDRSSLVNDTAGKLYKKTRFGDFIYSSNNLETGSIGLNKYGNASISPVYSIFEPTGIADSDFIGRRLVRKDFINAMVKWRQGVVYGQWKIHESDFIKIEVAVPSVDEQRQIGMFLDQLDNLITLQQRECERLQIVKKSMLENMFPKNGERVPKIRFSGFTDDWEQRKLSELVERYEDPVETPHDGYIRLGIRSHAKGTFHEYVEPGHELETAQMHRVAANKLIFNITFAWEHAVAITDKNDAGKLVSHRFPQFTLLDLIRPEFLKYVILDEDFHHNLYLASPGGAGRNRVLKIDEALDYPIYYPSADEQHKIGVFLDKLSDLITLHQSKLEKLRLIKKSMLEQMFV
jgi:type I restriction enzyme S subunit